MRIELRTDSDRMVRPAPLKRRVPLIKFTVYVCLLGLITISLLQHSFLSETSTSAFNKQMISKSSSRTEFYKERANHLRKTCKYLEDRVEKVQYTDLNFKQQIYTMGKASVCVVPKSGCSFLKRLIYYLSDPHQLLYSDKLIHLRLEPRLAHIDKLQRKMFNLTRWEIHYQLDFTPLQISEEEFKNNDFKKVIVARNPYSRLYSAYIDKVYVPVFSDIFKAKVMRMIAKGMKLEKSQMCSDYVSFEDFLEIVISESKKGNGDPHWLPTSVLCNACEVNPDIVIKQENYYEDVNFFLSQTDLNETQWKTINSAIAKHGIQSDSIIRGLIKTMYYKGLESEIDCFSNIQIAQRVWEALKIQGQIYQFLEFPAEQLERAEELSVAEVTEIFMSKMKEMPITAEESKNQRQTSIARAYRHIRPALIIQIQAMFYYDFMIFEYDFNPPK